MSTLNLTHESLTFIQAFKRFYNSIMTPTALVFLFLLKRQLKFLEQLKIDDNYMNLIKRQNSFLFS
jgi:hypothetical protein